ncbi:uncharacterized protein LOC120423235 [Culex pipiens pallens]|uniref:uncharacterized protein LOC120423235 n=1 Tax=Culex pipiens pallens TaxID=42434 RepID=UPI001953A90A|nr:uncharacterized protein LOC120423235 [Culex pipiens pallens]
MTSVRPRENTFKVDLSVFPKRPSFEEIHSFVHDVMGLRIDQVKRLQMNHVQNAAHVKCDTLKTAQDAVEEHDGRHEIELNKVKYKVRLQMDDSTVEVKVHDLSENVRDEELIGFLRHYGDVHCIKELVWGGNFAYKGISSGIRVKSDLSDRLKAAQSTDSTSYATVVDKGTAIINSLLPNFVATNLNQLNQAASESKQKELDTTAQQPSCSHLSTATDGVEQSSSSTITPAVAEDDSMSDETIVPVANETELMDQDLQQRGIAMEQLALPVCKGGLNLHLPVHKCKALLVSRYIADREYTPFARNFEQQMSNPPNVMGIPALYPCLKVVAKLLPYIPTNLTANPSASTLHEYYRENLRVPKVMEENPNIDWNRELSEQF